MTTAPEDQFVHAHEQENVVNPSISKDLQAGFEMLQNDLEQANQFVVELQRELAGKNNEFAFLKQLFEKTQHDLLRLQENIEALREERHKFANSLMRVTGLEMQLQLATEEREQLLTTVAESKRCEENALALLSRRNTEMAELTMNFMHLKEDLKQAQNRAAEIRTGPRLPKSSAADRVGL